MVIVSHRSYSICLTMPAAIRQMEHAEEEPSRVTWEIQERDAGVCLVTVIQT